MIPINPFETNSVKPLHNDPVVTALSKARVYGVWPAATGTVEGSGVAGFRMSRLWICEAFKLNTKLIQGFILSCASERLNPVRQRSFRLSEVSVEVYVKG